MAQQKCRSCKNFWKRISDWLDHIASGSCDSGIVGNAGRSKNFDDREYSYSNTDLHLVSGNSGKKSFDADFDRLSFRRFCGGIYAGWWRNFFYGKGRRDSLHFIILFRYLSGNPGILDGIQKMVIALADKTKPYLAVFVTAVLTGVVACNQTLSIILTDQLCSRTEADKEKFANYLEDSAVVIAPLIPWSIAGAVPLAAVGAPESSVLFALFLYLLPLWDLLIKK